MEDESALERNDAKLPTLDLVGTLIIDKLIIIIIDKL